jgi:hypothetical protein
MSQTISTRLEFLRSNVEGLLESRLHRKGARPVRRGGVGVLGQPRPGPLPDKGHRWSREIHRVGTRNAHRPKECVCQPHERDVTTGKRSAVRVACCVWGGADGKGLFTQHLAGGLLHLEGGGWKRVT